MSDLFFYFFAFVAIASALMTILAKNPVYSVLALMLATFNVAGLFVLANAEYLALMLVLINAGAVAILFLFVVLVLDKSLPELSEGYRQNLPIGVLVSLVLLAQLIAVVSAWIASPSAFNTASAPMPEDKGIGNIEAIGDILYTKYIYFFQISGFVLSIAMVGAIFLTQRNMDSSQRRSAAEQSARDARRIIRAKPAVPEKVQAKEKKT